MERIIEGHCTDHRIRLCHDEHVAAATPQEGSGLPKALEHVGLSGTRSGALALGGEIVDAVCEVSYAENATLAQRSRTSTSDFNDASVARWRHVHRIRARLSAVLTV